MFFRIQEEFRSVGAQTSLRGLGLGEGDLAGGVKHTPGRTDTAAPLPFPLPPVLMLFKLFPSTRVGDYLFPRSKGDFLAFNFKVRALTYRNSKSLF